MFKNCKKSVCSTNSIVSVPNTKKVSVLRHSELEQDSRSQSVIQGTNLWLRNGGVLPLVSVGPPPRKMPTQNSTKHVIQTAETLRWRKPKQSTKTQTRHPSKITSNMEVDYHTQVSLKPLNTKQERVSGRDGVHLGDKENYMNILSHFNDQGYTNIYNPDEFSTMKNKTKSSSAKRTLQASLPQEKIQYSKKNEGGEKVQYSERDKAEILQSIREELRLWKCNDQLND